MKNIKKIIDSLNLIYYEYDNKKNHLIQDENYSNKFTKLEFFKITYYLSKKNIHFNVLKDKSISFSEKRSDIKEYLLTIIKNSINRNQNIFLLNDEKIKWVKNIPLFKITFLPKKIDLTNYDIIIFTSKNAVKAIDSINKDWKNIPAYVPSKQTAKLVQDLNGKIEYISKTDSGDKFAYEISNLLKNKKVLYLRGEKTVSNLINILKNEKINCHDEIIYKNSFNNSIKKIKIPKNSKIIFTSPSTIEYFFKTFSWDESYKAISIGKTTAQYFPKNVKPVISDKTSFKACIDKALQIS